jgi:hypothetical protein
MIETTESVSIVVEKGEKKGKPRGNQGEIKYVLVHREDLDR